MNLTEALERINNFTGAENENQLRDWLETTVGYHQNSGIRTKVYRIYYVCALDLWLRGENNVIKGEGAELNQNFETTRRFLMMQKLEDVQLKLVIPEEYTVRAFLRSLPESPKRPSILGF